MGLRFVAFTLLLLSAFTASLAQSDANDPTLACNSRIGVFPQTHAFRVGAGVTAPQILMQVHPTYPDWARHEKTEGKVILSLIVDKDGFPRDLCILHSLRGDFDQNAAKAVSQWRFQPGMKEGKPVATRINVEVNFRLFERNGQNTPAPVAQSH